MRAIGGERSAVDFEDQRHALPFDMAGRQGQPALDRLAVVARGDGDLADLAERFHFAQRAVEVGEDARVAAACQLHLGRTGRGAAGEGDRAAVGDGEAAAGVRPVHPAARQTGSGSAYASVEPDARDLGFAVIVVLRIDRLAVTGPFDRIYAIVPIGGQAALARAVAVHDVELRVFISAQFVVEAKVSDLAAVGRNERARVGTVAVGKRADPAARHVERIDFAFDRIAFPVGAAVGSEIECAAIARPTERAAVVIGPESELARRAAGRGNEENLLEARLDIALAIGAIGEEVADLERFGPFRALGLVRGGAAELRPFVLDQHRIGDRAAVGRPGDARRAGGQTGEAYRLAAVHPAHPELRAAALGRGEGEAFAVGRP